MKISIIGCWGAGKTTLANQLAAGLNLPVFHIDDYRDRATKEVIPSFQTIHSNWVAGDNWIIEGNNPGNLRERASHSDVVVWITTLPLVCIGRILRRSRVGIHEKPTWRFLLQTLRFNRDYASRLKAAIVGAPCILIGSQRAIIKQFNDLVTADQPCIRGVGA